MGLAFNHEGIKEMGNLFTMTRMIVERYKMGFAMRYRLGEAAGTNEVEISMRIDRTICLEGHMSVVCI